MNRKYAVLAGAMLCATLAFAAPTAYATLAADALAQLNKGATLEEQGKFVEAIAEYRKVAPAYPDQTKICAEAQLGIGRVQFRQGSLDDSLSSFAQVLSAYPSERQVCAKAMLGRGDLYQETRDYPLAIREYRALVGNYSDIPAKARTAQLQLATCLEASGSLTQALGEFQKSFDDPKIQKYPTIAANCLFRRGIILERLGVYDEALTEFQKIPSLYPGEAFAWGNARVEMARCYLSKQQTKQAKDTLYALAADPIIGQSPVVAHEVAVALFEVGDAAAGETALQRAVQVAATLWPADRAAVARIDAALRLQKLDEVKSLGQAFTALGSIDKAVCAEAAFFQANAVEMLGDKTGALAAYESLVAIYGGQFGDAMDSAAGALYRIGVISLSNGDRGRGLTALNRVLSDYRYSLFEAGSKRVIEDLSSNAPVGVVKEAQ